MNFNDAIPLKGRAKFSEGSKLASSRDSRNNSQIWKKGRDTESQQYGYGQSIQKISREVSKLKRRIVGGFITPPQTVPFEPFKIYGINNSTNANDSAFTFQICGGLVGCRPRYTIPGSGFGFGIDENAAPFFISNYYQITPANGGPQDELLPFSDQVILGNVGDTDIPPFNQIVLQKDPDDAGSILASFWLEINDNTVGDGGFSISLKGRMWSFSGGQGRTQDAFPASASNIFPIGVINGSAPSDFSISQIQFGNILPEYSAISPDYGIQSIGQNLGLWSEVEAKWSDLGVSGMLFYNGDTVIDDTVTDSKALVSPAGSFTYNKIYCYIGGMNQETTAPNTVPAHWKYVGAYF